MDHWIETCKGGQNIMSGKHYTYETCCVDIPQYQVADLQAMIDAGRDVTYETFQRHCAGLAEWAVEHGYEGPHERGGLHIKNDWHVGYFKSTFRGRPCYYMSWSGIEFIWTKAESRSSQSNTRSQPLISFISPMDFLTGSRPKKGIAS
jgi:hypothetical protein